MKVDVIIPTRNREALNKELLTSLKNQKYLGEIIVIDTKPLSYARIEGGKRAVTEIVAMVDDDMFLPLNWISQLIPKMQDGVGAVSTVALQENKSVMAYDKVVNMIKPLHTIDTSPHINNILIRRNLLVKHKPPPIFFGEDILLKKFVQDSGYIWKTFPFIGAIHLNTSKNHVILGIEYNKRHCYSMFQIVRRFVARFVLIPYAAMVNTSLETMVYLNTINIEFLAGWIKGMIS